MLLFILITFRRNDSWQRFQLSIRILKRSDDNLLKQIDPQIPHSLSRRVDEVAVMVHGVMGHVVFQSGKIVFVG